MKNFLSSFPSHMTVSESGEVTHELLYSKVIQKQLMLELNESNCISMKDGGAFKKGHKNNEILKEKVCIFLWVGNFPAF